MGKGTLQHLFTVGVPTAPHAVLLAVHVVALFRETAAVVPLPPRTDFEPAFVFALAQAAVFVDVHHLPTGSTRSPTFSSHPTPPLPSRPVRTGVLGAGHCGSVARALTPRSAIAGSSLDGGPCDASTSSRGGGTLAAEGSSNRLPVLATARGSSMIGSFSVRDSLEPELLGGLADAAGCGALRPLPRQPK